MNKEKIVIPQSEINTFSDKHNVQVIKPVELKNYPSFSIAEMKENPPKEIEYVFSPCLPKQGIGWIYAASGMGKTLFALNLAYAIASGGRFLKYICPAPRKVLYVDGEMPYNQLYSRLMTIQEKEGELDFPDYLQFLTPEKIYPFPIPKIDEEEGQTIYQEKIIKEGHEVIIFDNLSMLSSFDENKAHEFKPILNWLVKLRTQGTTIIMIHHSGKDKNGYRGSSSMLDNAEFTLSLQPINDNELEEFLVAAKKFKVKYGKTRSFGGADALPYEVSFENGIWSYKSMEKSELELVVEWAKLKVTQMTMAKELGCGQPKVAKLIAKARKMGLLNY